MIVRVARSPRPLVFKRRGRWWVVWVGPPAVRRTFAEAVDLGACWWAFTVAMCLPEPEREARDA